MHRRCRCAALAAAVCVSSSSLTLAQSVQPAVFVVNNVSHNVTSFHHRAERAAHLVNSFPTGNNPQATSLSPDGLGWPSPTGRSRRRSRSWASSAESRRDSHAGRPDARARFAARHRGDRQDTIACHGDRSGAASRSATSASDGRITQVVQGLSGSFTRASRSPARRARSTRRTRPPTPSARSAFMPTAL